MFGDIEEPNLTDLETAATQVLWTQATAAEKLNVETAEGPILADEMTRVTVTSLPIPMEFSLEPKMMPETDFMKEPSKRDPKKWISQFYYTCQKCGNSAQNKSSMFTHAHHCFHIKLVCPVCHKVYKSPNYMEKHVKEAHDDKCESEAEEGITSMSTEQIIFQFHVHLAIVNKYFKLNLFCHFLCKLQTSSQFPINNDTFQNPELVSHNYFASYQRNRVLNIHSNKVNK